LWTFLNSLLQKVECRKIDYNYCCGTAQDSQTHTLISTDKAILYCRISFCFTCQKMPFRRRCALDLFLSMLGHSKRQHLFMYLYRCLFGCFRPTVGGCALFRVASILGRSRFCVEGPTYLTVPQDSFRLRLCRQVLFGCWKSSPVLSQSSDPTYFTKDIYISLLQTSLTVNAHQTTAPRNKHDEARNGRGNQISTALLRRVCRWVPFGKLLFIGDRHCGHDWIDHSLWHVRSERTRLRVEVVTVNGKYLGRESKYHHHLYRIAKVD